MIRKLALLALLVAAPASAADLTVDALAKALAARPVASVSFTQEQHVAGLKRPIRSTGEIRFDGGDMVYAVTAPVAETYRLTAKGAYEHLENGRYVRMPDGNGAGAVFTRPLMLLFGGRIDEAKKSFDYVLTGSADAWRLALTPKDARLRRAIPHLDVEGGALIRSVTLRQDGDGFTSFTLDHHKLRGR